MSINQRLHDSIKNIHLFRKQALTAVAVVAIVAAPVFMSGLRAHAANDNLYPSTTPNASINTSDGSGVELGVKFTSDVSGTVTGVRFYKGDATNGGTHYGHLWSASGIMLAQAQFTNETTSGWQDVSFSSPVSISANTVYVASYYAPQGHYDYTTGSLSTAQDNPPLHTVADTVSPDGVYAYTSNTTGAFPASSYNATNYWVDVDFTPSSGSADTTPPTVSVTSPTSSQTVSGSITISANASDNVAVASVQFYLDGQSLGSPVTNTPYSINWDTTLATDGPHALTAKATDTSGNTTTSASVTVTVRNGTTTYDNIFTSANTPATPVTSDTGAVELGVKFTSDTNGQIKGIRFYKGDATNGGTHYGHLWTASGTQLGQVQFSNESSTGWQDAKFASPISITAGTTYIASYYAPQGHYSDTSAGLTNAVDNAPLHALANSTSANGVFTYTGVATGAFPSSTWNASNYWVDVDFTAGSGGDTIAPTVSVTSPTSGQTISGTTSLTASATDNTAVASVQFYLDGQALGTAITSTPYTYNWDTTTVASGTHTVTAKATDTSGNVGSSAAVTVTVQNGASSGSTTSIWPSTATPTHADGGDPTSGNLGVKFTSDTNGYITGVRFYKGDSNNGGTHIGDLWSSAGILLAQATFTNESNSGWQNVAFSTGVPVTAGTTYVASYFDPQGRYSYDHGTDPGGLTSAVNNPPLHALASGASGGNGVYNISSSASFPTQTYSDSNYWVDVFYATTNTPPDTTAPTVSVTSPTSGQTISGTTSLTASATDNTAVASVQFYLDGQAIGNPVTSSPYTLSWDTTAASNGTHILTAKAVDTNGNSGTSSSVQITVQNNVPPRAGIRGTGPILVLTDPSNAFSDDYCAALLKTEGLPECAATDTGNLDSNFSLSSYRTIILADGSPLTSSQVTLINNWVSAGGTFIAMRPNDNLDTLLGIGQSAGTLSDAYFKVNSTQLPGIETQTMQYHGTADKHSLTGAAALATLYSDANTATSYPAITKNSIGSGTAIAYMFDVSKSVLLTRNGNPALAGQVTVSSSFDGYPRIVDRFANGWLDTSKVTIPQADELQRTLANLVEQSSSTPRLWYFPAYKGGSIKAALILTGDDHATNSQTLNRFAAEQAADPANCSIADWTCYTSTSYAFPGAFSDTAAKPYTDNGFEVSPHIADGTSCLSNWSNYSQLDSKVSTAISAWQASYPTISAAYPPQTERIHCYGIWNDYASIPQDEAAHGIKADANSPCWPNSFLNVGQCLFTGTGMPEDYSDASGKLANVYQFTTQATDENPSTVDKTAMNTLVTNATGPNAYYGYFTVLCHMDNLAISNQCATDLLSIAQTNNIPMVSAKQAEQFWDGRNNTSISNISYGASSLTFSVNAAANNIQEMTPVSYNGKTLSGISVGGTAANYTTQTVNGVQYAILTLSSGNSNIVASYQ